MSDKANTEQIERFMDGMRRKHSNNHYSRRWMKKVKIRQERRRAKANPECVVKYRKYYGWEY